MYSLLVMGIFHCYVSLPERILIYSHLISGLKCPYLLQPLTLEACHSLDLGQIHARSGKITWRSLDNETYTVYIYTCIHLCISLHSKNSYVFFPWQLSSHILQSGHTVTYTCEDYVTCACMRHLYKRLFVRAIHVPTNPIIFCVDDGNDLTCASAQHAPLAKESTSEKSGRI